MVKNEVRICLGCKEYFVPQHELANVCPPCIRKSTYRPPKKNKYNAKKTEVDNIRFDSIAESNMYKQLKPLEQAGAIRDLQFQVPFELIPEFVNANGKKQKPVTYIADFVFFDTEKNRTRVLDCKGYRTDMYKMKKKIFDWRYGRENLFLEETI